MPLEPGRRLAHYHIVRQIGQGGTGAVFLARDTKLDRKVALKVLPPEMAASAERLERLRREAKALAALDHSRTVTAHRAPRTVLGLASPGQRARGRWRADARSFWPRCRPGTAS